MTTRALEGQTALVTGGGKGIGRAIALALAARGVRVVVTGRSERALGEVVGEIANAGGKGRHLAGDVRHMDHLKSAVKKATDVFGGLDIVVANAGASGRVPLGGDLERAGEMLQTNLIGTYQTFHAALEAMKGPGRLVALSSVLATFGVPGYAAYCASKAGILGLVRAAAQEVGPRGITCNAILAGWVDSAASPPGRSLEPEEVAELVVFVCSSAADGITGQALSICGGAMALGG